MIGGVHYLNKIAINFKEVGEKYQEQRKHGQIQKKNTGLVKGR